MKDIVVLGGGSWGTAIANLLGNKGYRVTIWLRDEMQAKEINKTRVNKKYLPDIELSENLNFTSKLDIFEGVDIIISAIPTQSCREVFKKIKNFVEKDAIIVNLSKGLEIGTLYRISEIVEQELKDLRYCVLSGPSHAEEVAKDLPTTVVASSKSREVAERIQDLFMTNRFRVYTNPDVIGVEIGGALKNIIALGAGITDGYGYGDNTKAALMSRGFIEMAKLGIKMGASGATFSGLSGIGDLIVTCTSIHSRNRRAGILMGKGHTSKEATEEIGMVVEGIKTTKAAYEISKKYGVEMPITTELYKMIFEDNPLDDAVYSLMSRSKKHELEEILNNKTIEWDK
ncbi:MAG: NAD(P)H-dependent glycerol-3-phosphate dehydrogenase [Andreesenia angusta]|nr:NAD(P)H-dependent glycerol-3-phosphate dehydrogenase [Andreesenia angusta]